MGGDSLDHTASLQFFNFEFMWFPGWGTICNFCHSFNEVKLQYLKSQGQWIGIWSLFFMNPNKYIVAILADRHCFCSKIWGDFFIAAGNPGTFTTFQKLKCVRPQSNKRVSALHKLIDLLSLTEAELLRSWCEETTAIEAIPFLSLSFGY